MIGVLVLIGPAANNPTRLIADLRFSHSRFRRRGWMSFRIVRLSFAAPRADRRKPARHHLRFCNLGLQPLHESIKRP